MSMIVIILVRDRIPYFTTTALLEYTAHNSTEDYKKQRQLKLTFIFNSYPIYYQS